MVRYRADVGQPIGDNAPLAVAARRKFMVMCLSATAVRPLSVLIADAYPDAADSLADILEAAGHRAAVARTGPEAVAAALRDRPDVVVLELWLPGLDGLEVARRLRANGCAARLVAVTTCGRPEDHERSRAAGIDCHLVKPADPTVLLTVLTAPFGAAVPAEHPVDARWWLPASRPGVLVPAGREAGRPGDVATDP